MFWVSFQVLFSKLAQELYIKKSLGWLPGLEIVGDPGTHGRIFGDVGPVKTLSSKSLRARFLS